MNINKIMFVEPYLSFVFYIEKMKPWHTFSYIA